MLFPPERWLEGANISGGQKKLDKRGVLPKREPRSGSIYQPRVGASSANPRLEPNRLPTLKGLLYLNFAPKKVEKGGKGLGCQL